MSSNTWRYLLYELNGDGTETLVNPELPLSSVSLGRQLSGHHEITATIANPTRFLQRPDGSPLIRRRKSMIVAEDPNSQIWLCGIVMNVDIDGPSLTIDAAGFTAFPAGEPFDGAVDFVEADPIVVYRWIWDWIQSQPGGNLGLVMDGTVLTSARVGRVGHATDDLGRELNLAVPHAQWAELARLEWVGGPVNREHVSQELWGWLINHGFTHTAETTIIPPVNWSDEFPWWEAELLNLGWVGGAVQQIHVRPELWEYLKAHGWTGKPDDEMEALYAPTGGENVSIVQAAPYALNWWSTDDLGAKLDELAEYFDFREEHSWGEGDRISHRLHFGVPTIGNRRENLRFVLGENVFKLPRESLNGDGVATGVIVLGAGEGSTRIRGSAFATPSSSLRRVKTVTDKSITDPQAAEERARRELAKYTGERAGAGITELLVRNGPNAEFGTYDVGDEILYSGDHDWGPVDVWVKIVKITVTPDQSDDIVIGVVRADAS